MRDRALAVLTARHATFVERAKRRLLTDAERSEVDRLGVVIDTLQAMGGSTSA